MTKSRGLKRPNGSGSFNAAGYAQRVIDGEHWYDHVLIAEAALGKPLPPGAEVHHVNENKGDNRHGEDGVHNLVICPDRAYHFLLHRRQKALDACGHADWRQCCYCKEWSPPEDVHTVATRDTMSYHRACERAHRQKRKA